MNRIERNARIANITAIKVINGFGETRYRFVDGVQMIGPNKGQPNRSLRNWKTKREAIEAGRREWRL